MLINKQSILIILEVILCHSEIAPVFIDLPKDQVYKIESVFSCSYKNVLERISTLKNIDKSKIKEFKNVISNFKDNEFFQFFIQQSKYKIPAFIKRNGRKKLLNRFLRAKALIKQFSIRKSSNIEETFKSIKTISNLSIDNFNCKTTVSVKYEEYFNSYRLLIELEIVEDNINIQIKNIDALIFLLGSINVKNVEIILVNTTVIPKTFENLVWPKSVQKIEIRGNEGPNKLTIERPIKIPTDQMPNIDLIFFDSLLVLPINLENIKTMFFNKCIFKALILNGLNSLIDVSLNRCDIDMLSVKNLTNLASFIIARSEMNKVQLDNLPKLSYLFLLKSVFQGFTIFNTPILERFDIELCDIKNKDFWLSSLQKNFKADRSNNIATA